MENAILVASVIIAFALMVGFAAFGSAIGDGIIGSKAVESIARQAGAARYLSDVRFTLFGKFHVLLAAVFLCGWEFPTKN